MKYPSISTCLCGFLLVCFSTSAGARPISPGDLNSRNNDDPMLALPSNGQQQSYEQRAPQQEVRYVTYRPRSRLEHQASASPQYEEVVVEHQALPVTNDEHQQHQQQHQQQQVVYNELEQPAPYQLIQEETQPHNGQEYSPTELQQPASEQIEVNREAKEAATGGEYPGEIVYVGSNGQTSDESSLAAVANTLRRNSGLAATILTEVPVSDMPYEVLEKLKHEYGVKVVATRERPGANLVINCDDHSANRESSVCSKQARYPQVTHEHHYQYQPQPVVEYHTLEPSEHEHQAQAQYQYQHQATHVKAHEAPLSHGEQVSAYAATGPNLEHQPHVRRYSHRGAVGEQPAYGHAATGAREQAPGPEAHLTTVAIGENGEHQQHAAEQNEFYGSRTATTATVSEQPGAADEVRPSREAEQEAQAQQASPANSQNESVDQQGGFEEQAPKQLEGEQNTYRPYGQ